MTLYEIRIAEAWAAFHRKQPNVPFYAFASAFNAGWTGAESNSL